MATQRSQIHLTEVPEEAGYLPDAQKILRKMVQKGICTQGEANVLLNATAPEKWDNKISVRDAIKRYTKNGGAEPGFRARLGTLFLKFMSLSLYGKDYDEVSRKQMTTNRGRKISSTRSRNKTVQAAITKEAMRRGRKELGLPSVGRLSQEDRKRLNRKYREIMIQSQSQSV